MTGLLSIENLTIAAGQKVLVDRISFEMPKGKIVALAGGSGSGKTTIGLSVLRLLPPALRVIQGSILFEGSELLRLTERQMRSCRGGRIGMIFQEPLLAFDPVFTIGQQLDEVLTAHTSLSKQERYQKSINILSEVELPDPVRVYKSYPHQLSGGMRQRAMVAQAMAVGPSLVIADEPTSSLDVTLQEKIAELLAGLRHKNISVLLIAHDWGLIARLADEVIVLRHGQIIDRGKTAQLMRAPGHEYTKQLIEASAFL